MTRATLRGLRHEETAPRARLQLLPRARLQLLPQARQQSQPALCRHAQTKRQRRGHVCNHGRSGNGANWCTPIVRGRGRVRLAGRCPVPAPRACGPRRRVGAASPSRSASTWRPARTFGTGRTEAAGLHATQETGITHIASPWPVGGDGGAEPISCGSASRPFEVRFAM